MAQINPYLNFNGNTEEAFEFYKSVFGGEFSMLIRFKEMQSQEFEVADADANKIMHISFPIGNNILMATDFLESMGQKIQEGNRYSISISADSKEEADKLFNGLSKGGKVEMPMADSSWNTYFGLFNDKFGIQWMIEFAPKSNV